MIRVKAQSVIVKYKPIYSLGGEVVKTIGVPELRAGESQATLFDLSETPDCQAELSVRRRKDGKIADGCSDPVYVFGYDEPVVFYLFEPEQIRAANNE